MTSLMMMMSSGRLIAVEAEEGVALVTAFVRELACARVHWKATNARCS
jgi:hypothetical protein